jgi:hypothetical protein
MGIDRLTFTDLDALDASAKYFRRISNAGVLFGPIHGRPFLQLSGALVGFRESLPAGGNGLEDNLRLTSETRASRGA